MKRSVDWFVHALWIGFFQFLFLISILLVPPIIYWMYGFAAEFEEKAVDSTGTVVRMHYETLSTGGRRSDPEITFQTREGEQVTFIDQTYLNVPVSVGQQVPVRYMPNDPKWARIAIRDLQKQDRTMALVVLGFLFLASIPLLVLTTRAQVRHFRSGRAPAGEGPD